MAKKKQYVVWGLGRFGTSVARSLQSLEYEVLGIDHNEEVVQELSRELTHVVVADSVDEATVKALGLHEFDVAVVGIGDLQASLLCTMLLKEAGIHKIVAKATSPIHGKMLTKLGANKIIYPERDMGQRVAHNLVSSNIMDYIELSDDVSIVEMSIPKELIGQTLISGDIRRKYSVNVIGVKRNNKIEINFSPEEPFLAGDVIVVVGTKANIAVMEDKV